jgi:hypothetical protein
VSAHAAILALLQQAGGLTALVGDRIFPNELPDPPVYPALTYQKVGGASARGAVENPGLGRASFQVSTWARTLDEVVAIADEVRKALDRKRKAVVAGVQVDDCFYEDDVDSSDTTEKVYFNHMSFRLHYRETR